MEYQPKVLVTMKPRGTLSILTDTASGIHPSPAPYFKRPSMSVHELTPQHPKALEALEAKKAAKRDRAYQAMFVEALVRDCGYRFCDFPGGFLVRPMTVCYIIQKKDVMHVSTALAHPNDKYNKALGRFQAATAMRHGHWITLRKPTDTTAANFLYGVFGNANVLSVELMT